VRRASSQLEAAELNDERRSKRLKKIVDKLARNPSVPLPDAFGSEAEIEAAYRFLNNPAVTMDILNDAHAKQTARSARAITGPILAIHDGTSCSFPHADPASVGYLNTGKPGFQLQVSLVCDPKGPRRPIGIACVQELVDKKKPSPKGTKKPQRSRRQTGHQPTPHSEKWWAGISATQRLLPKNNVIHVADREADGYELLSRCQGEGVRFVFRARVVEERKLLDESGERVPLLDYAAQNAKVFARRVIGLAPREQNPLPSAHLSRSGREATISISALTITLRRPHSAPPSSSATVEVNLVRVLEEDPPAGCEPVQWCLFTSEPIKTKRQVEQIVDWYRDRWLIEEFFKALKTGCGYESRQFETIEPLLALLALYLPIACEVLWLRSRARESPDAPATEVFSKLQLRLLETISGLVLPPRPTARQAIEMLAAIGGHLRTNGEPGWQVLMRAKVKLDAFEQGWLARGRKK
jgi:hypothetical protein